MLHDHEVVPVGGRLTASKLRDEEGQVLERLSSLQLNSVAAIKENVAHGLGVTLVPRVSVRQEMARGSLAVLPWDEGETEVACLMIWLRERWQSPALQTFMQLAREIVYQE